MVVAKVCASRSCEELALPGRAHCEECAAVRDAREARRRQEAKRASAAWAHLLASAWWRRNSKAFLKAHPLCVSCQEIGLVVAAREVDHITPHRGDLALFRDRKNWQGLCTPCHSRKTAREVLNPKRVGGEGPYWPPDH